MRTSYKFRMYTTRKNHRLNRLVTTAGRIWNHCVAFQRTHFRLFGKYCHKFTLMRHIAKIRNRRSDWQIVGSQCVQAIIERLDLTYQAFFKWVKTRTGRKRGKPKFKRSAGHGSVTFKQASWSYLGGNKIRFGKHVYKFVKSREIEGKVKTCTLKRDSLGRFWVVFSCEQEEPAFQATGSINTAGFDFGLKTFLTCSDGTTIDNPQFFRRGMAEIKRLSQSLARKKRGSSNRRKAKYRLGKAHDRIANRRADWLFKLANSLCGRFDYLYFETLNIQAMQRMWGRKVSDVAFSQFMGIVKWVAYKRGKQVRQIGKWEPTTKTCSNCGHKQDLKLSDRVFDCECCHVHVDRDLNAAVNIQRLGHQADGLGDVRHGFGCAVPV